MDAKRLVIGTVAGGVVMYFVGYLIFDLAFGDFYAAHAGSATGVPREPQLVWAALLGTLAYAALVTLGIGDRAGSMTMGTGVKIGAVVGFLLWLTVDFIFYAGTNMGTLTTAMVDPLLELVRGGIGGGVIAVVLSKVPASE